MDIDYPSFLTRSGYGKCLPNASQRLGRLDGAVYPEPLLKVAKGIKKNTLSFVCVLNDNIQITAIDSVFIDVILTKTYVIFAQSF